MGADVVRLAVRAAAVEILQARVDAGVQSFMLHTMTPDPAQLEQWATHIIPHVRFPTAAG